MGANTKIEWAHHTFNPWWGCTPVSSACDFCYAEALAKRLGKPELWKGERSRTSPDNWKKPLQWDRAAKATGERHRVFCASMADVFDNQVPEEWRTDLWTLIEATPNLDWLLLTKRPQNIAKMLPVPHDNRNAWPWSNVWLGTTVENQNEACRRIPSLLRAPARVRFLSCEPLLGEINLRNIGGGFIDLHDALTGWWEDDNDATGSSTRTGRTVNIDWVIAGGESGHGARPMHPNWVRSLRDQCRETNVPFFFKQHGEWLYTGDDDCQISYGRHERFCFGDPDRDNPWVYRVGKAKAGRLLDGREHNELPSAA